ncbi:MAG: hypothetical protein ACFCBW_18910 [Candidatus Competibacterales bacterium]
MGISESKRQKQLAKKKQKRKMKQAVVAAIAQRPSNILHTAKQSALSPIHECLVSQELFEGEGMGNIVISRRINDLEFAISVILLDVYCLGVKNAYFRVVSKADYKMTISHIERHEILRSIEPACTRKLVEECIAYAKNIGFDPHPDYEFAQYIFGDIDTEQCAESYTFGKDGKPLYISGPNEGEDEIQEILKTLTEHCGEENFNVIINTGSLSL